MATKAKIAFLHPDLGIGGAERLIVDAALALKSSGHSISIFTSHHDTGHCFSETRDGQLEVITAGDWIPRSTLGRLKALWAYVRMLYLTVFFLWYYAAVYDIVVCDIISAWMGLLRRWKQKSIFYCHYPDQLLTKRETLLKKLYRWPIDWLEGCIVYSDVILVNSQFTQGVFNETFNSLQVKTRVLYPTVNFSVFDKPVSGNLDIKLDSAVQTLFLSINRYERKKCLNLAIESLRELYNANNLNDAKSRASVHLIMVGGYDPLNVENIEHYEELVELTQKLDISGNVTFLRSPSDEQKQNLLHSCTAVIYTPENEHFGIVPLEAMYMRRPVIATNSGGPKETVLDGETGFLCEANPVAFSVAMNRLVRDKSLSREMGIRGRERVTARFNFATFQAELNDVVNGLLVEGQ